MREYHTYTQWGLKEVCDFCDKEKPVRFICIEGTPVLGCCKECDPDPNEEFDDDYYYVK